MLTRQNQGSLGASYWRMTSQDDRLPRGVSICLVVVVCASLRMLLSCLVPARGSWCLGVVLGCCASIGALLRLHGCWSWLPSPGIVSGRCSVRRPPRCHVRHRCIGRGGVGRWHVGHLCLFPELHRRVRHPTRGPCGGFCTTRGCDTPATRRQRASCSAKPPHRPRRRAPQHPTGRLGHQGTAAECDTNSQWSGPTVSLRRLGTTAGPEATS